MNMRTLRHANSVSTKAIATIMTIYLEMDVTWWPERWMK